MAEQIPYVIPLNAVLAGNASISLQYSVPQAWTLDIKEWFWTSTGVFRINDILDSRGVHYTNASQSIPILSTFLRNPGNSNISFDDFMLPLHVNGGDTIFIQITDTSGGGNTINCVLNTVVNLPTGSG